MRLSATNISSLSKSFISIVERDQPSFTSEYHFHPEYELVYIKEGYGKKIIGNNIDEFKEGELILIGPNVPHVWMSDQSFTSDGLKRSKATVVYFDARIFSDLFFEMEETRQLNKLFSYAEHGIKITGEAKEQTILKLKKMSEATGFDKIICLLDMLNTISAESEMSCLKPKVSITHQQPSGRLTYIFDYINANIKKSITLKDAAKVVNLTPESFCRYFKQKTGKKFIDYLHETRIFYAKRLLLNSDLTIAEVAYKTGFKTASNFNKLFKKNTGFCPTSYRKADVGAAV